METKTKRTIKVRTILTINEDLVRIVGASSPEMPYTQFLKSLWKYLKANKLYRVEKIGNNN